MVAGGTGYAHPAARYVGHRGAVWAQPRVEGITARRQFSQSTIVYVEQEHPPRKSKTHPASIWRSVVGHNAFAGFPGPLSSSRFCRRIVAFSQ
jgi:hypothetical protein